MMMDSLDLTDADRARIVSACQRCEESRIVISHGTDTMVDTAQAIAAEDIDVLTKIPGIGKKGAARMCVELKDKFGASPTADGWRTSVRDALVGLGWSASNAESAVDAVAAEHSNPEVADALRAALQLLGRR